MRIWSKQLIKVLPTKQLKAMRYELGDMIKQYPNIKHSLTRFANNYDIAYLGEYFNVVLYHCNLANIEMSESYNDKIFKIIREKTKLDHDVSGNVWHGLVFREDNDRYLTQCYYNLQEKYDRGVLNDIEWQRIEVFYNERNNT